MSVVTTSYKMKTRNRHDSFNSNPAACFNDFLSFTNHSIKLNINHSNCQFTVTVTLFERRLDELLNVAVCTVSLNLEECKSHVEVKNSNRFYFDFSTFVPAVTATKHKIHFATPMNNCVECVKISCISI